MDSSRCISFGKLNRQLQCNAMKRNIKRTGKQIKHTAVFKSLKIKSKGFHFAFLRFQIYKDHNKRNTVPNKIQDLYFFFPMLQLYNSPASCRYLASTVYFPTA